MFIYRIAAVVAALMSSAASAGAGPNPFKPIINAAVGGLVVIAAVLLAIGLIKLLLVMAMKRRQPQRSGRPTTGRSNRRDPKSPPRREPVLIAASKRDGVEPSPLRPAPTVKPSSAPIAEPGAGPANGSAPTVWSIALIRELEWKRFEELCALFWQRKGYPARLTGAGADGGVDVVIADQRDPARTFAVAQCKSWSSKSVGVEAVRALWGARDHFKAQLALFYSLSGFTQDARAFAEGKHLKLISGEELLQQIEAMPAADQVTLLAEVTRGDYTTPTCPTCDIKMSRRPGRDGKPDFWGCNNYRRCGARPIVCRS